MSKELLREALQSVVAAWDSVPGGRHSIDRMQRWLLTDMAPAINGCRQALTAALADGAVMEEGWQPIETAPKDGTAILVFEEETCGQFVAYWSNREEDWFPFGWNELESGVRATHWRPLPAAPKPASSETGGA